MPAARKSTAKAAGAARPAPAAASPAPSARAAVGSEDEVVPVDAVEPERAAGTPAATGEQPDDPSVEEVPLNRAARRAKGKGQQQANPYGPGKVVGGKGPRQGPRMWANRRSG